MKLSHGRLSCLDSLTQKKTYSNMLSGSKSRREAGNSGVTPVVGVGAVLLPDAVRVASVFDISILSN